MTDGTWTPLGYPARPVPAPHPESLPVYEGDNRGGFGAGSVSVRVPRRGVPRTESEVSPRLLLQALVLLSGQEERWLAEDTSGSVLSPTHLCQVFGWGDGYHGFPCDSGSLSLPRRGRRVSQSRLTPELVPRGAPLSRPSGRPSPTLVFSPVSLLHPCRPVYDPVKNGEVTGRGQSPWRRLPGPRHPVLPVP